MAVEMRGSFRGGASQDGENHVKKPSIHGTWRQAGISLRHFQRPRAEQEFFMRILLVEDNRDILANMADYLQIKGYTVDLFVDVFGRYLPPNRHT